VGTIKSIGRIYQQTFLDTYSKLAFVKLYDRKNALLAESTTILNTSFAVLPTILGMSLLFSWKRVQHLRLRTRPLLPSLAICLAVERF
jgi:hypothetical protein